MDVRRIVRNVASSWSWIRWPVAVGILSFLFFNYRDEFTDLLKQPINPFFLGVAFVLCGGSILLTFVRWFLLVWGQDIPFRVSDAIRLGFVGYLFNYVAPGAAGGDIVKAVMIARQQESRRTVAAATVLLDRILGVLALFMVGAAASLVHQDVWSHPTIGLMVGVLWIGAACGVVGLLLLMHPAVPRWRWIQSLTQIKYVGHHLRDVIDGIVLYQSRRRVLLAGMGLSLLGHMGMLSSFYFCSLALQTGTAAPGYWMHLMLIPGAELASVFVPLPGGVGALEGAVILVYQEAAIATNSAVSLKTAEAAGLATALAYRLISIVLAVIGAGYYMVSRSELGAVMKRDSSEQSPSTDNNVELEQPASR